MASREEESFYENRRLLLEALETIRKLEEEKIELTLTQCKIAKECQEKGLFRLLMDEDDLPAPLKGILRAQNNNQVDTGASMAHDLDVALVNEQSFIAETARPILPPQNVAGSDESGDVGEEININKLDEVESFGEPADKDKCVDIRKDNRKLIKKLAKEDKVFGNGQGTINVDIKLFGTLEAGKRFFGQRAEGRKLILNCLDARCQGDGPKRCARDLCMHICEAHSVIMDMYAFLRACTHLFSIKDERGVDHCCPFCGEHIHSYDDFLDHLKLAFGFLVPGETSRDISKLPYLSRIRKVLAMLTKEKLKEIFPETLPESSTDRQQQ